MRAFLTKTVGIGLGLLSLFAVSVAYATDVPLNTTGYGYRIEPGHTTAIDQHGVCYMVTNGASNSPLAVPTFTEPEWRNFYTHPPVNVLLAPCNGQVLGCTNPLANNYNPQATVDDGSCTFDNVVFGCTDSGAINYNPNANSDDGSCAQQCSDGSVIPISQTCPVTPGRCDNASCGNPGVGGQACGDHCDSGCPDFGTGACSPGSTCISEENGCGQTSTGTIQADGSCSATPPPLSPYIGGSCQSAENSCGQKGNGFIQCDGTCSASGVSDPPGVGNYCTSDPNSCGQISTGTIQCDGLCSAGNTPSDPSNLGDACTSGPNNCGERNSGTVQCGGCSASAPADKQSCGGYTCWDGSVVDNLGQCPCDPNAGNDCTSGPNACGLTSPGHIQCDGACDATPPSSCPPVIYGCTDSGASNYDSSATSDDGSCTYCAANVACTSGANNCGDTSTGTVQCDGSCSAGTPADRACGGGGIFCPTANDCDGGQLHCGESDGCGGSCGDPCEIGCGNENDPFCNPPPPPPEDVCADADCGDTGSDGETTCGHDYDCGCPGEDPSCQYCYGVSCGDAGIDGQPCGSPDDPGCGGGSTN